MMIDAIGAAASGISAAAAQAAAAAHNLANVQTVAPMDEAAFQGDRPLFSERHGGGVRVDVGRAGSDEGIPAFRPDHPEADNAGMVRFPDVDVAGEMVNLVVAEHAVAANVHTVNRAVDSYRDLLAMTDSDRSRAASTVTL